MFLNKLIPYYYPKILEIKNTLRNSNSNNSTIFSLFFTFLLATSLYLVASSAILTIEKGEKIIDPQTVLETIMHYYFYLIVIASFLACITNIFSAKNLEFVLCRPFKQEKFFSSKITEYSVTIFWFGFIVAFPIVFVFGSWQEADFFYYPLAIFMIALVHILATIFGTTFGYLVSPFLSAKKIKYFIVIFATLVLLFVASKVVLSNPEQFASNFYHIAINNNFDFFVPIKLFFITASSNIILTYLDINTNSILALNLKRFFLVFILSYFIGRLVFIKFFNHLYNIYQNNFNQTKVNYNLEKYLLANLFFLGTDFKNFLIKEIKIFNRDSLNTIQLIILIFAFVIYLGTLFSLPVLDDTAPVFREWFYIMIFIVNQVSVLLIGAVICARFVFISVSQEREAFWIIKSSPLDLKRYLKLKLKIWFCLISSMIGLFLLISNQIINPRGYYYLLNSFIGLITCYGIVGTAIGLGTYFVKFDWESISEITTSFGNFFYLVFSFIFIIINIIPTAFIIVLTKLLETSSNINPYSIVFYYSSLIILLIYLNVKVTNYSLTIGLNKLNKIS